MSCIGVGYYHLGKYGVRAIQCVICTITHQAEDYRCGIICCMNKIGKIAFMLYLNMQIVAQNIKPLYSNIRLG